MQFCQIDNSNWKQLSPSIDVVGDCSVVVGTSVGTEKRLGKNGKGKKGNEIT